MANATDGQARPRRSASEKNKAAGKHAKGGKAARERQSAASRTPSRLTRRVAERLDRPIILIGLMGVGKSVLGKKLARELGTSFVDADKEIEAAAGMPISEIFATLGEPSFRDGERRVILRLVQGMDRGVIALGGGAFEDPETRAACLEYGICIWLDARLESLTQRVTRNKDRPLVAQGNPAAILAKLYKKRKPAYALAPVRVRTDTGPHGKSLGLMLRQLDTFLKVRDKRANPTKPNPQEPQHEAA